MQLPSAQKPLTQSAATAQDCPTKQAPQLSPPQSTSVSPPFRMPSTHEAAGIVLLEPVLVPAWVYLAWSQTAHYTPPRWSTWVGGSFILLGLCMRCWSLKTAPANQLAAQENDPRRKTENRDQ